jgi:AraC-like DNA-binding protein
MSLPAPASAVISRDEEVSRVVGHWLSHLEHLLQPSGSLLYLQAINRAGITHSDLIDGGSLSFNQLDVVLRVVRRQVPDITLRLLNALEIVDLGLIGYAMLASDNIGAALRVQQQYHDLTSDRFHWRVETEDEFAVVYVTPRLRNIDEYVDIAEDALGGSWRLLQILLGPGHQQVMASVRLRFAHQPPDYVQTYQDIFNCPIEFDADNSAMLFPADWLALPVATANSVTAEVCTAMCERLLGTRGGAGDTPQAVRRLLLSRPGRRMLRLEEAAEAMRLSPAQLRKRLYRADTSYKQLVLDVRMALARHYLQATLLSVQDIAYLLDYSQPAPFSRAFKSYFRETPQQCRAQSQ